MSSIHEEPKIGNSERSLWEFSPVLWRLRVWLEIVEVGESMRVVRTFDFFLISVFGTAFFYSMWRLMKFIQRVSTGCVTCYFVWWIYNMIFKLQKIRQSWLIWRLFFLFGHFWLNILKGNQWVDIGKIGGFKKRLCYPRAGNSWFRKIDRSGGEDRPCAHLQESA